MGDTVKAGLNTHAQREFFGRWISFKNCHTVQVSSTNVTEWMTLRPESRTSCASNQIKKFSSVEILRFQQIANQLLSEGTVPVPPNPPLRFAIVLYYLRWNYRSRGDATAAGAEVLRAVAPKSVEKNIVRISTEPKIQ